MKFMDLRISKKIGIAFTALVALSGAMGGTVYYYKKSTEAYEDISRRHAAMATASIEARFALARQENSLRGFFITHDEYFSSRVKGKHYDAMLKSMDEIAATSQNDPAIVAQMKDLRTAVDAWQSNIADPVIRYASSDVTVPQALEILTSGAADKFIEPAENILDGLLDNEKKAVQEAWDAQESANHMADSILVIGLSLILAMAVGFGFLLSRGIARPINGLAASMRRLASGDKAVTIAGADRRDEIGAMAGAVETFKQAAIERDRLEAEAKAAREAQTAERERQMAAEHAKAEELSAFVHD
ncbi:CHASE3 domain-containing protein, partial [Aurantimonas sp. MSK8Z-1]|uniref:CHASE3 domain-containing protein n=1 Tax=Mangrovibrevibacter kandeliae TaxID=2968473 RepID=UPI0022303AC8